MVSTTLNKYAMPLKVLKTKGVVIRQMATPEKLEAVIEDKVEEVLESKKEEIRDKVEEVVQKIDDEADKVAEKIDAVAEDVIKKVEDVVPGGAKVVEVIDEALAGVGCSCVVLGWTLSARKLPRSPPK